MDSVNDDQVSIEPGRGRRLALVIGEGTRVENIEVITGLTANLVDTRWLYEYE